MIQEQYELTKAEMAALFAYLFGKIDNSGFRKRVNNGMRLKQRVDSSGYILMNCRLFAYAHYRAVHVDNDKPPRAKDFQVHQADARLLRRLDLSHIPNKYKAYTLREYNSIMSTFASSKEIKNYIGKFVSKKMRFIYQQYGVSRHDLEAQMLIAAIYGIYRAYPIYESYLHLENIGKTSIHNAGQSLIAKYAKEPRLSRNDDGTFEATHVSLDHLQLDEALVQDLQDKSFIEDSTQCLGAIQDKLSPRVKLYFRIMAGEYDKDFSFFLGTDNSEAIDSMRRDTYTKKVYQYLKITDDQVQALFSKIRMRTGWTA